MARRMQQRKLSSVFMTRQLHFRHMGLWIVLTIGLIVMLNICFYLLIEERWGKLTLSGTPDLPEYALLRQALFASQLLGFVVFSAALVALAMFTSHRVAGPYLRLKRAFDEVRDGDLDHQLVFRGYDHLDFLEESFNGMMSSIRDRVGQESVFEGQEAGQETAVDGQECPADAEVVAQEPVAEEQNAASPEAGEVEAKPQ